MVDEIDKRILYELAIDSSRNVEKLAKFINTPRSTVHNRIKKLEREGFIKGYRAIIDYEKIDRGLTTFTQITLTENASIQEVIKKLIADPRIEEIHTITGATDIIVKTRFKNPKEIATFSYNPEGQGLRTSSGISRTETAVVLHTIKEYGKGVRSDLFTEEDVKPKSKIYKYQNPP